VADRGFFCATNARKNYDKLFFSQAAEKQVKAFDAMAGGIASFTSRSPRVAFLCFVVANNSSHK
jgi:hypothetical protein